MAPALTETNQEDNFKLPHSPNSTSIINPALTQNNGDRYTCNIPFEINPKYHLSDMCIGKSDAELNSFISAKEILRLNGDSVLNGCNDGSNYNGENLESEYKFSRKQSQGKSTSDVCELSKLVMQKLAHANVPAYHSKNTHCPDGDKKVADFAPKINGEVVEDTDLKRNVKTEQPCALEEKIKWDNATKKLEKLQDNTLRLMRQIRCLQMQNVALHVSNEIGSFVSYGRTKLDKYQEGYRKMKMMQKPTYSSNKFVNQVSSVALSQMKKKVHYMKEKHGILFQTSPPIEPISNDTADVSNGKIDPGDCVEINQTVGTLLFNLKHLESGIDSDATESSSGGESCDEYEDIDDRRKNYQVPILCFPFINYRYKRAVWKWAVNRAEVARRWIWLQAQIVDLEQRIRRLNALCQKFHSAKESYNSFHSAELEDNTNEKFQSISSVDNNNHKDSHWIKSNGYNIQNAKNSSISDRSEHYLPGVSRTRPLKAFRKRKLYWLTDIHLKGTKAAKLSSVKCSCKSQENMISCILCSGQYNRILALDPDVMSVSERISRLESSYHSVLSFQQGKIIIISAILY
ncbi:KAT8 regulatory NSL complex subunit 1-like isoform X1 [Centruroides sculpturatus]|uniref:KAT8 regulatory NSL complex subunit 1-like isoform X1 n=1 Tax=Centruroides sculpturatus TaxID=218467 RepID=UPI000C6DE03E|nr:KAT8 regulatory NSL complex subunit 1-like isoform X1 [Centruroides sculpturatus]XP_023212755.1 KAT8 regulatory NSL complex subunit 1-like isoform X1 [Centruroides sculpturatus]